MLATSPDEQRRIIAERVHVLRWRRKDRSQRGISRSLGWGANRVGQVERAEVDLTMTELYALAAALNTSVEYLLGIDDQPATLGENGSTREYDEPLWYRPAA